MSRNEFILYAKICNVNYFFHSDYCSYHYYFSLNISQCICRHNSTANTTADTISRVVYLFYGAISYACVVLLMLFKTLIEIGGRIGM